MKQLTSSQKNYFKFLVVLAFFFQLFAGTNAFANSKNVLFLGDSLTEGYGLDEGESFPRIVETILQNKKQDVKIINGGITGSTSASGLSRLKWHLKKPMDVLVLELGANDGLRGLKLEVTEKNLREIIKIAKDKKVKVLLLGLLMPPNYGKAYVNDFEKMYKKIADSEKVPFMPFLLNDVAGVVKYNLADGIHPNAEGHKIIAKNVAEFLEKNL